MSDWDNTYEFAGPGGKRRRAEERRRRGKEERPHSSGTKRKTKAKPVRERLTTEWRDVSGLEIKSRILALTLAGNDPRQILAALEKDNIRATLLTIGNLNRLYREVVKLLRGMGLIDERRLSRYLERE